MTEEEFDKKYNKIYKKKTNSLHSEPSPETRERLSVLENNHQTMMDKLTELKEDNKEEHKALSVTIIEIKTLLDKLPELMTDKFDNRYASKDTETALKRVMWIVISIVITALVGLVIVETKV